MMGYFAKKMELEQLEVDHQGALTETKTEINSHLITHVTVLITMQ